MKNLKKTYTSPGAEALADAEALMAHADELWLTYLEAVRSGAEDINPGIAKLREQAVSYYTAAQAKFAAAQFYLSR